VTCIYRWSRAPVLTRTRGIKAVSVLLAETGLPPGHHARSRRRFRPMRHPRRPYTQAQSPRPSMAGNFISTGRDSIRSSAKTNQAQICLHVRRVDRYGMQLRQSEGVRDLLRVGICNVLHKHAKQHSARLQLPNRGPQMSMSIFYSTSCIIWLWWYCDTIITKQHSQPARIEMIAE
jgi:hypothetical protein